ncbi:hypothetical protein CNMCM6805_001040 [Aspergillus fumigatiaffinis]|uniref:Nucleoside phosphorylase domain-containing protein n=1 Tax=Aspergillus fumigatiaffinis TaxID=340414 RepID=A0A8H4M548_9EURO|nr:hypothetical protein CNMCM6805_001040 [Aspergillus fumigatiaffinis]
MFRLSPSDAHDAMEAHAANRSCRPEGRDGFEIAIICALTIERDPIEALLDEEYETDAFSYGKADGDLNSYTTGRLANHHVVIVYMPEVGITSAAAVVANLRSSFRRIKIGILVGICGGVPKVPRRAEIVLGDVIISTSVIQFDNGKQYPNTFIRKDTLGRSNPEIGCGIETQITRDRIQAAKGIAPNGSPTTEADIQEARKPRIHFGQIACGNQVMKSAQHRDKIATEEGVIAFEMESAGTWDYVPTLVIKSVADYADCHKSKEWQGYAAITAAACTKAVLEEWRSTDSVTEYRTTETLIEFERLDRANHQGTQASRESVAHGPVYNISTKDTDASFQEIHYRTRAAINRSNEEIQRSQRQRESQSAQMRNLNVEITTIGQAFFVLLLGAVSPVGSILTAFMEYMKVLLDSSGTLGAMTEATESSLQSLLVSEGEVEVVKEAVREEVGWLEQVAMLDQHDFESDNSLSHGAFVYSLPEGVPIRKEADDSDISSRQVQGETLYGTDTQANRDDSNIIHISARKLSHQEDHVASDQTSVQPSFDPKTNQDTDDENKTIPHCDKIAILQEAHSRLARCLEQIKVEIQANEHALEAERRRILELEREIERLNKERNSRWSNWCVIL